MDPSSRKQGKVIPSEMILSWWDVVVVIIGPVDLDWVFLLLCVVRGPLLPGWGLVLGGSFIPIPLTTRLPFSSHFPP